MRRIIVHNQTSSHDELIENKCRAKFPLSLHPLHCSLDSYQVPKPKKRKNVEFYRALNYTRWNLLLSIRVLLFLWNIYKVYVINKQWLSIFKTEGLTGGIEFGIISILS